MANKKQIDKTDFEKLCGLQCTREEICDFFDLTTKTLDRWCKDTYGETFSLVFAKKRGLGKISLRRNMFHLSKINASMCIFMAKNWLGMRDIPVDDDYGAPVEPVTVTIKVSDATRSASE